MLKNIYAPLSGGLAQEKVLEIIANNLANANTSGFKEEQVTFRAMNADPWPSYASALPPQPYKMDMQELYPLRGNEMGYVALADVSTSFQQGTLSQTSNPLDVALQGDGLFAVNTPFGERFTRDGSFTLSPEGVLTTKNGAMVQGTSGIIAGLKEGDVKILGTGEVYVNDRYVDKIRTVAFKDTTTLQKIGDNLYVHDGTSDNLKNHEGQVLQGYVENSNVNPIKNLTNMIMAHRSYEALQKAVKTHDDLLQVSANKIGSLE